MTPLHVLTHGMGMGMGLIMCCNISSNIGVPWAQAHNLQTNLKDSNVINHQLTSTININIMIKHTINHMVTFTIPNMNIFSIDVVLLLLHKFTNCI